MQENIKDISQLKESQKELEAFSYRVSHDLMGPIASTRNMIELIKMEFDSIMTDYKRVAPEESIKQYNLPEYLPILDDLLANQTETIEDLLELSKHHQTVFDIEKTDLKEIIQHQIDVLKQTQVISL